MRSQAYSINHGLLHQNPNRPKNDSTKVVITASSSDDEAEQNSSGKRRRPMSVSYAIHAPANGNSLTAL